MKIRDASPSDKKKPEPPKIPQHLFDQGLMAGITIDPEDQIKERAHIVKAQSSLAANVPSSKTTQTEVDGKWTRQETPSLGVPYGISELWVRPLDVPILAKVHAAQAMGEREDIPNAGQASFTMLVDALATTIKDFDIRDLTVPDYNSHIYWLKLNSYPKSPFTVPWTSRYNNENFTRVNRSHFEFKELQMTREEYVEWNKMGISFPTVRDMELLYDPDLDKETHWTMTYAQYIYLDEEPHVDTMRRKVEKLEELGPDIISKINEFSALATHGVVEQLHLRDEKFELDAAIEFLSNQFDVLSQVLETHAREKNKENGDGDLRQFISLTTYVAGLDAELKVLRKVKENNGFDEQGRPFKPEVEVVALASANATFLFP